MWGGPEDGKFLLSKLLSDSQGLTLLKLESNTIHRGPQTPAILGVGDKLPSSGLSGSAMVSVREGLVWVQKRGWDLTDGGPLPGGKTGVLGVGWSLPFLHLAPTSPCPFPFHQSCGYAAKSNIRKRGRWRGSGKTAAERDFCKGPCRRTKCSHAQPGLPETLLGVQLPRSQSSQTPPGSPPWGT